VPFSLSPNVHVVRDPDGTVRHLRHHQQPYRPEDAGLAAPGPGAMADQYLRDVAELYRIPEEWLTDLYGEISPEPIREGTRLKRLDEKVLVDTTVVSYQQTHLGLPIWEASLSVRAHGTPPRVISSTSTLHYGVEVELPPRRSFEGFTGEEPAAVRRALRSRVRRGPTLNATRLLIYRYDPEMRLDPATRIPPPGDEEAEEHVEERQALRGAPPTLPLPSVPDTIEPGRHYVVREVLFTLSPPGWGDVNWRAFVELETQAVLYLRAFVAAATGCVFQRDPVTSTGALYCGSGDEANLNAARTTATLLGLNPPSAGVQSLAGQFASVSDTDPPTVAPPTATPPYAFCYSAITDNFSATNAYHHTDALYRMVESMGFPVGSYFPNTTSPVPVDHRGFSGVNAFAMGNTAGNGMGRFLYGILTTGQPIGIVNDVRVVLHEFGHALLYDHVSSPNFGFAHSAGDTLGAIFHDPGTLASDRFNTFPWTTGCNPSISRRHDRDVAAGWAWGGTFDDTQYGSEQILSTTLFRAYRCTGGDDPNITVQRFAARYLAFLIVKAIGTLTATTTNPDVFATALMDADDTTVNFEGHPGGAFHKVVRWSFEKQGLYQPPGAPTQVTTPGAPPTVDVYIDDVRNGEYAPYLQNFWNATDIWNRLAADGGTTHQTPIVNQTNYLYVRVKNRGTQTATGVEVKCYHCKPGTGLVWPDDWQATTTPQLSAPGPIASGGAVVVGPFQWTPTVVGHECLLASASVTPGDLSNCDTVNGSIPHWRLVPFDNNIAQRNVAPVASGPFTLVESFRGRHFFVNNPFDRSVRIEIQAVLPEFLRRRRWGIRFLSPGADAFTLGPRGSREVVLYLEQGEDFSVDDVVAAEPNTGIDLLTLADGLPIGGMTYRVDPSLKEPPRELPEGAPPAECADAARRLLECLDLPAQKVARVRLKRVTIDVDLEEDP
jgi:hypothetical protein